MRQRLRVFPGLFYGCGIAVVALSAQIGSLSRETIAVVVAGTASVIVLASSFFLSRAAPYEVNKFYLVGAAIGVVIPSLAYVGNLSWPVLHALWISLIAVVPPIIAQSLGRRLPTL